MKLLCLFWFGICALTSDQFEAAVSGHAFLNSDKDRLPHHVVKSADGSVHAVGESLGAIHFMLEHRQPAFDGGLIKHPELFDDRKAPDHISAFVFGAFTAMSIYQMVIEMSLRKHKKLAIGIGLVSFVLIAFTVIKLREVMQTYAYFSFVVGLVAMLLFNGLSYAYFYFSTEDEEERMGLVRAQMFSLWLVLFLLQLWFAVLQDEKYIVRMRAAEAKAIEAEEQAIAAESLANAVDREQQTHLERIRTLEHGFDYHHSSVKAMEKRQQQHASRIKRLEKHANKSRSEDDETVGVIDRIVDGILDDLWPGVSH